MKTLVIPRTTTLVIFACFLLAGELPSLAAVPTANTGNQYRADTGAAIPFTTGTIPTGVGVYLEANVADADGNTIKMEVELRKLPATFTGAATHSSGFVSSGTRARTATATSLTAGNYGWRYRVVDSTGAASNWVAEGNPDFIVQATTPIVQTLPATSITTGSAVLNARITSDGGSSILERRFSYGTTPACSDGYTSAVTVNGNDFYWTLAELPPGTLYYFQAWARNSTGWGNSSAASFTTLSQAAPTVQTLAATSVTTNSAQMNATVNPNGESSGYYFQYGSTTNYGSSSSVGSAGSGTYAVSVSATLLGLTPGATYHYRIVAYNGGGTSYGSDAAFTASQS